MIGLRPSGLAATGRRPVRVVIGSAVVLVVVALGAGCGTRQAVVDAAAQPIVDRMRAAPEVRRWTFTYQPRSGSPYVACLTGIDEIEGSVDLDSGAIELTPNRDAPPIAITAWRPGGRQHPQRSTPGTRTPCSTISAVTVWTRCSAQRWPRSSPTAPVSLTPPRLATPQSTSQHPFVETAILEQVGVGLSHQTPV